MRHRVTAAVNSFIRGFQIITGGALCETKRITEKSKQRFCQSFGRKRQIQQEVMESFARKFDFSDVPHAKHILGTSKS
jgi:hypothetical protein